MTYAILCRICALGAHPAIRQTSNGQRSVITTVFILGVLNLCLGFVLAAYAEQAAGRLVSALAAGSVVDWPAPALPPDDAKSAPSPPPAHEATTEPEPFATRSLPRRWRQILDDHHVNPGSALESLLWIIKLEIGVLRGHLVQLETRLRGADGNATWLARWRAIHQEWTTCLQEFAEVLAGAGHQSAHVEIESSLQDLLLDHQFAAHQMSTALDLMNGSNGHEAGQKASCYSVTVRRQLAEQIDELHVLRDRVDNLLATFLREDGRLGDVNDMLQIEGVSEIYNRIGFEAVFEQWRDAQSEGGEPVCCLLVDIDRFSQKNEQFGNQTGDIIMAAFGGLLQSLIRVERGFDRVARFNGRCYVLFLGSTKLDDAATVAERTRQCIEATSFKVGDESFEITTSLGLGEFEPHLGLTEFYRSLEAAVASAKSAGRNRTCIVRGGQLEIAATAVVQVKGRVIEIAPPVAV